MDIQAVIDQFGAQANNIDPIGAKVKFVLDDHSVMIDGTGDSNVISADDSEADCTISTSLETLEKMKNGDLNPMMAVMGGKVKIKGDMGLAMKLQGMMS